MSQNTETVKTRSPWIGCMPYFIATVLVLMTGNAASPTMPFVTEEFNLTALSLPWVTVANTLAAAVCSTILCWFGDVRSMKKSVLLGLTGYILSFVICGAANSFVIYCIGSFLRGFAIASVIPATMTYIAINFPKEKSVGAFAFVGAAMSLGAAIGPLISGILLESFGWRGVNYACGVISAVCLVLIIFGVKDTPGLIPDRKLDLPGFVTLFFAVGCGLVAFSLANILGWGNMIVLGLLAAMVVMFVLFYMCEKNRDDGMVNFALFKRRGFTMPTILYALQPALNTFICTAVSYYILAGLGKSPTFSGAWLAFFFFCSFIFAFFASKIGEKISSRTFMTVSVTCWAIGYIILCFNVPETPISMLFVAAFFISIGNAFIPGVTQDVALKNVDQVYAASASGTINLFNQLGVPLVSCLVIPYLAIFAAENGVPNYGLSFHLTARLMMIVIALAYLCIILTPSDKKSNPQ